MVNESLMLSELLPLAISIAKSAGGKVMEVYREGTIDAFKKEDGSPLTEADLASHRIIANGLEAIAPNWPVLSEEAAPVSFGERRHWKRYWLVDPLDGTKEFLRKTGEFTINIALIEERFPVLGVVYAPAIGKLYYAAREMGAFCEMGGKVERLAVMPRCGGIIRVVASRSHRGEKLDAFLEKLGEFETLSMGSSLKFCLVAEGSADIYPRLSPTMEWDTAAAQCIVEEAGGKVVDLSGNRLQYNKDDLRNPDFLAFCGNFHFAKMPD